MISIATSIAALACAPMEAVPPDIGMITPILTTLSSARAVAVSASDIAAAQSSLVTCLNVIKSDLPKGFPDQDYFESCELSARFRLVLPGRARMACQPMTGK